MCANMYAAYDALSPGMQRPARRTCGRSTAPRSPTSRRRARTASATAATSTIVSTSPSIRSCARTRRPGARRCTSTSRTRCGSTGMTEEESRPLLQYPVRALDPARVHVPVPVAGRIGRALGQPLRDAQPDQRLPRLHPDDAPHQPGGRRPDVSVRSEVTWPTIPAMLRDAARRAGEAEAVVDGARRVDFAGLQSMVDEAARATRGVRHRAGRPGGRLGAELPRVDRRRPRRDHRRGRAGAGQHAVPWCRSVVRPRTQCGASALHGARVPRHRLPGAARDRRSRPPRARAHGPARRCAR